MHVDPTPGGLQPHLTRAAYGQAHARPGHPAAPLSAPPTLSSGAPLPVAARELELEDDPITLEGLKRAWGTSSERYDLNGDGIVNVSDLLAFLAQQTERETADAPSLSGPVAATPVADDVADAPDLSAPPEPLTVEGLQDAWGTDNSDYDLNGDGIVNVSDLLAFLAEQQQPKTDTSDEVADEPAPTPPPTPITVEGFQDVWGTDNPDYDLNGDGVVNVSDLLAFLAQQAPPGEPPTVTAEGFQDAWGTDNPDYDLNGDGVVNVSDLLAFLAQAGSPGDGDGARVPDPTAVPSGLQLVPPGQAEADRLAGSLIRRFEAAGFTEQPPSNARQIVEHLGLDDLVQRLIVDRLSSRYPHGLGLDLQG